MPGEQGQNRAQNINAYFYQNPELHTDYMRAQMALSNETPVLDGPESETEEANSNGDTGEHNPFSCHRLYQAQQ